MDEDVVGAGACGCVCALIVGVVILALLCVIKFLWSYLFS